MTMEMPPRGVSGGGAAEAVGRETAALGSRALRVSGARWSGTETLRAAAASLRAHGVDAIAVSQDSGEPTLERLEETVRIAEAERVTVVVGLGGGSVLDVAKATAGLCFPGRKPVSEYFYGLRADSDSALPWIALPTTAGTGSEATPNAVLSDGDRQKQSIRGDRRWLAATVLLDPGLTVSCSPQVTAWSGMDALTQAIESHTSAGAHVLTEPCSAEAVRLIAGSIRRAHREPEDVQARTDMAYGSLLAGIALANARLGVVHGLAHPLGLRYHIPHGLVCGVLLPWAIAYNTPACADKYGDLARLGGAGHAAQDLLDWVRAANRELGIPYSLRAFGLRREDFAWIVEQSMPSGSLRANPRPVRPEDLFDLLDAQLSR